MQIFNPPRAIFTSLKNAIVHNSRSGLPQERSAFADEQSILITGEGVISVNSMAFGGDGVEDTQVMIHPGSYVDNQPLTQDSVDFSFKGHRYRSYQYNASDSGALKHSLRVLDGDRWRLIDGVY